MGGTALFRDNQSAINLTKNPVLYEIQFQAYCYTVRFIRKSVDEGYFCLEFMRTLTMVGDQLTKHVGVKVLKIEKSPVGNIGDFLNGGKKSMGKKTANSRVRILIMLVRVCFTGCSEL